MQGEYLIPIQWGLVESLKDTNVKLSEAILNCRANCINLGVRKTSPIGISTNSLKPELKQKIPLETHAPTLNASHLHS